MTLHRSLFRRSALLVGVAAYAAAGSGSPHAGATTSWVTAPGGLPLFDLSDTAPGDHGSATLTVTNPRSFPVSFSIAVTGVASDDNGCNEPEEAIGDTTCGEGGGELQLDLRLSLTAIGDPNRLIFVGTAGEWASEPVADAVELDGNEARTYRVGYELPIGSSNVTQSDSVAFDLELRVDGIESSEAGLTAVLPATPSLPATGIDIRAMALGAFSFVFAGLVLYRLSLRRRREA